MQACCEDDERGMSSWQIGGEPAWQEDVGDRSSLSAEGLGQPREGTACSVAEEDEAFDADYGTG